VQRDARSIRGAESRLLCIVSPPSGVVPDGAAIEGQRRMAPRRPFRLRGLPCVSPPRRGGGTHRREGEGLLRGRLLAFNQRSTEASSGRGGRGRGAPVSRSSPYRRRRTAPRGGEFSHGQTGLLRPATIGPRGGGALIDRQRRSGVSIPPSQVRATGVRRPPRRGGWRTPAEGRGLCPRRPYRCFALWRSSCIGKTGNVARDSAASTARRCPKQSARRACVLRCVPIRRCRSARVSRHGSGEPSGRLRRVTSKPHRAPVSCPRRCR